MPKIPDSAWGRRRPTDLTVGLLVCAAWVGVYVLGGFSFAGASEDRRSLFWAAAMMSSFAGWGRAVSRWIDPQAEVDWGLRAAWGMATFTFLGGILVALGVGTAPWLRVLVGAGIGIACADVLRHDARPLRAPRDPAHWAVLAVVAAICFLSCVGSMTDRGQWWAYDDTPAYLVFPKQLSEVGSMLQPFSFRRMSSFGAQSLFQAVLFVGAAPEKVHLFDRGVCQVVVVSMILGAPSERDSAPFVLRLFPALLVLFLPNYRMNVAAVLSGTIFFFAIYRTLDVSASPLRRPAAHAAIVGLLVASACALRPFFVLPATGTVALAHAFGKARPTRVTGLRHPLLVAGGVAFLAVLPWSLALVRSNGTPLYPPFHGNYLVESGFSHLVLGYPRTKMIWQQLRYWEPISTVHIFFIAGLIATKYDTPAFRGTFVALLAGFLLMLALIPISDYRDLARYAYPLELAFVLAITMRSLTAFAGPREPATMAAGLLVLLASLGELSWKHDEEQVSYDDVFEQALSLLEGRALMRGAGRSAMYTVGASNDPDVPTVALRAAATYSEMQRSVPEGAPLLAMVEEPYRFDFQRNPVAILDLPGVVGPRGGIPVFEGPDAVARYFRGLGYRYLAVIDTRSSTELYSQHAWEGHARPVPIVPQNFIAARVLDIFASLRDLAHSRRRLFDKGGMIVIDSDAPA